MKRAVIGLVGPIASGKGFLAEFLVGKGFSYWSLSDRVREEADRRGLPRERNILQDIGNDLRQNSGPAVLAKKTMALVPDEVDLVLIDSIRNPTEIDYLKAFGAVIVGIDAPLHKRLEWYLKRAAERGEDGASEADFYQANARDLGEGEDAYGQQGALCLKLSDIRLENDGTEKFLREGLERLREGLGWGLDGGPEGPPSTKESETPLPAPLRWRR
ncbi:MAG: hypothetical protein WAV56_00725 [Microgenomates group bacterium]